MITNQEYFLMSCFTHINEHSQNYSGATLWYSGANSTHSVSRSPVGIWLALKPNLHGEMVLACSLPCICLVSALQLVLVHGTQRHCWCGSTEMGSWSHSGLLEILVKVLHVKLNDAFLEVRPPWMDAVLKEASQTALGGLTVSVLPT